MEVERDDGRTTRDRALQAMGSEQDVEKRVGLWRLAVRFNKKMREATVEKSAASLTRAGIAVGRRVVPK